MPAPPPSAAPASAPVAAAAGLAAAAPPDASSPGPVDPFASSASSDCDDEAAAVAAAEPAGVRSSRAVSQLLTPDPFADASPVSTSAADTSAAGVSDLPASPTVPRRSAAQVASASSSSAGLLASLPRETLPVGYEGRTVSVRTSDASPGAVSPSSGFGARLGSKLGLLTKHTTYLVQTDQHGRCCTVERRYKHFEWLYDALVRTNPYRLVPTLPVKEFFRRFQQNFLARRRACLEAFLNYCTNHPVLALAKPLELFLTVSDRGEWDKIIAVKASAAERSTIGVPATGVGSYLTPAHRIFAEAMARKVNNYQAFIKAAMQASDSREARIREDIKDLALFRDSLHSALDDSFMPVAHTSDALTQAGLWVRDLDSALERYGREVEHEVWSYQGLLGISIGIANGMANVVARRNAAAAAVQQASTAAGSARGKALQSPDDLNADRLAREAEAAEHAARREQEVALFCALQEWRIFHEYQPELVAQIMQQFVVGESASLPERVRELWLQVSAPTANA